MVSSDCECGGTMDLGRGDHRFTEIGLDFVWLRDWPIYRCRKCGYKSPVLPDPDKAAQVILPSLVTRESRLDGKSIRYLRAELRMTAQMLADAVGVHRVEVSRWENGGAGIDAYHDFRLRMEVVERLLPDSLRDAAKIRLASIFHRKYGRATRKPPLYLEAPLRADPRFFSHPTTGG